MKRTPTTAAVAQTAERGARNSEDGGSIPAQQLHQQVLKNAERQLDVMQRTASLNYATVNK